MNGHGGSEAYVARPGRAALGGMTVLALNLVVLASFPMGAYMTWTNWPELHWALRTAAAVFGGGFSAAAVEMVGGFALAFVVGWAAEARENSDPAVGLGIFAKLVAGLFFVLAVLYLVAPIFLVPPGETGRLNAQTAETLHSGIGMAAIAAVVLLSSGSVAGRRRGSVWTLYVAMVLLSAGFAVGRGLVVGNTLHWALFVAMVGHGIFWGLLALAASWNYDRVQRKHRAAASRA